MKWSSCALLCACFAICLSPLTMLVAKGPGTDNAEPEVTQTDTSAAYEPEIEPASDQGEKAISSFTYDKKLKVELFAAEPMLANPVAFSVDELGRFYVVESFRHGNTPQSTSTDDDLASRTVEDRIAMHKRKHGDEWINYTMRHERLRLIEDTNGDGKADKSTVFADGFNNVETGLAAGALATRDGVYLTSIPDMWLLKDTDGDGKADERRSLSHGYGVHVGFRGHDMHGPLLYVDGKIYWTIGDRGFNVETLEGGRLYSPDRGGVIRCNPDGTELEIFHTGLRNPQDLTFDEYGNLFTGDNNSDGGDKARVVHVVEGGDSGWNIGFQYMGDKAYTRGPWNAEKLWHPQFEGQASWHLPPISWLGNGPSGVAFYPGTGLNDDYRGHMFHVDYNGSAARTGVYAYRFKPNGASYELDNLHKFVFGLSCSDVEFGYDGIYISDWASAWNAANKGRLYRVFDPKTADSEDVKSTRKLMHEGMAQRQVRELESLLAHADQRVRLAAQLELVKRKEAGTAALNRTALKSDHQLARLHAIWGLGILGRRDANTLQSILPLLNDKDSEVRSQTAKVIGDARFAAAYDSMLPLLADDSSRVRLFAATTIGRLGNPAAIPALLALLRDNQDQDPYLRHAGVMGLSGLSQADELVKHVDDVDRSVRMGLLLALRRLKDPRVAMFLHDADQEIVTSAARAINDVPINEAMPELASLIDPFLESNGDSTTAAEVNEPLQRRILNANFRAGQTENAQKLVLFAASASNSDAMRREAMAALESWTSPGARDRVVNLHRPLASRGAEPVARALKQHLATILKTATDPIKQDAIRLVGHYNIPGGNDVLAAWVRDGKQLKATRVEALKLLAQLKDPRLETHVELALADKDPELRVASARVLATRNPARTVQLLVPIVKSSDSLLEQQETLLTLGTLKHAEADAAIATWLDNLMAGDFPQTLHLDLVEAAAKRDNPSVKKKLAAYEASFLEGDELGPYRSALAGGDYWRGRDIFVGNMNVKCLRCHKIGTVGGSAGPALTTVGVDKPREYLLESIVHPSAKIAKGFETVVITTVEGRIISGIVQDENEKRLQLLTPKLKVVDIPIDEIDERDTGRSGMPEEFGTQLNKFDLRDLVEFLSIMGKTRPTR